MSTTEQEPVMVLDVSGIKYPVYALMPEKQAREFIKLVDKADKNKNSPRKLQKPLAQALTIFLLTVASCLRLNEQQLAAIPPTVLNLLIEKIVLASLGNAKIS